MKKKKYIVYLTTNKINSIIYVGVHRTDDNDKFDGYIGCGCYREMSNPTTDFQKAVCELGYKNFKRKTLFEYPDTKEGRQAAYAKEFEIVDLDFVDSPMTYNMVIGGERPLAELKKRKISQYTLEGKFIKTWDSIVEAEETLNLTAIGQNLMGSSKYCGNFQWKYYEENTDDIPPVQLKEKTVYQFDLKGNLLKVWKSASEASLTFKNAHAARVAIHNVCNNITRLAYGYYWSFKKHFNYVEYSRFKAVAKYNDEGKFIESYSSLQEAAKDNNIKSTTSISHAIAGKQKHSGGFRWRLFYGDTSDIKPL